MLWRNLITTVALLSFLVDLADTCQGQDKCQFVVDTLKSMVFLVLPLLSSCPQQNRVIPGVSCPLVIDPDGQVSLEILLVSFHRGMLTAWTQCWNEMHADGFLSAGWEAQVSFPDMIIFLTLLHRFRRSKRKKTMQEAAYTLMRHLQDSLLSLLADLLDRHLLSLEMASEAPLARVFRTARVCTNLVLKIVTH